MIQRYILLAMLVCALPALSGCALPGAVAMSSIAGGGLGATIGTQLLGCPTAGALWPSFDAEAIDIVAKATTLHNLELALAKLNQQPTVVMQPAPVVITPQPPAPPAPPVIVAPLPIPGQPPPFPTSPPVTPSARQQAGG